MLFELVAVIAAGLFSGAATYITFVEHPARLACGPVVALAQWRPSYQRATVMQASLAVLGLASAVAAWLAGRGTAVLAGGLVLGSVVPFTLLGIRPTNRRLEEPARAADTPETEQLLRRWGTLHAGRTAAALVAFGILAAHAVAAGLGARPAQAQAPPADSAAVLRAVAAYDAAWAAKDTAAVGRWLSPDYRYFTSTGGVWSRAQLLALLAAPAYRLERVERSELEARITATTAVVSSRWQGRGTYPGGRFDDDQRCSLVLAKQGTAWSLLAEHCTQIRPG